MDFESIKIFLYTFNSRITVTTGTYIVLGVLFLRFILDFIINGKVLDGRRFLAFEARTAYFMFFTLFGISSMLVVAIIVSVTLFLKPSQTQYGIIAGAATFSSVFSGLCFAAARASQADSAANYKYCGKRFLDATINFLFFMLIHYLYVWVSPYVREHGEACKLHPFELTLQAIVVFLGFIFLVVGVSIFTHAIIRLQKESITYPTDKP